jgi:hypothetical protein
MNDNPDKIKAAARLVSLVAEDIVKHLGPLDAGGLLLGTGRGILEVGLGRDAALTQLRALVETLEADGSPATFHEVRQVMRAKATELVGKFGTPKAANIFLGIGLAMCTDGCGDDQSIVQHLRDIADNMEAGNDDEIPAPPKRH